MTRDGLVPFRPVHAVGDRLVPAESPADAELVPRLRQVLAFYDVPFEESAGELMVPEAVAADLDTCWNYTSKANDEEWLRTHEP